MRPAMCGKSSRSTEAIGRRPRTRAPTGPQRFPMTDSVGDERSREEQTTDERSREEQTTDERSREEQTTDERSREEQTTDECSREEQTTDECSREEQTIYAVVVTHRRPEELAKSLDALSAQTRAPDHLVVVDNDDDSRVRDTVSGQPIPTTYLGSHRNLGGAGGFALGMLHALALGADWVWRADDDGRPLDSEVLGTLLTCAQNHELAEVSPMVCDMNDPERLAFPLRRG